MILQHKREQVETLAKQGVLDHELAEELTNVIDERLFAVKSFRPSPQMLSRREEDAEAQSRSSTGKFVSLGESSSGDDASHRGASAASGTAASGGGGDATGGHVEVEMQERK